MTLGEKIRCARKYIGISQGQLAEQMCVSRSAVAKWETDKGLPDVENLKLLSRLLCVSVDTLLDEGENGSNFLIRQRYCLEALGPGCSKVKKDRLMRQKFPEARITALMGRPELVREKQTVDRIRGFLTTNPQGCEEYIRSLRNTDRSFYLVDWEEEQYFVTVTDEYLEIMPLPEKRTERRFRIGNWNFVCREEL